MTDQTTDIASDEGDKSDAPLAVVTGASSGIGKAIAIQFARRGIRTVLAARRMERLTDLANELRTFAPSWPYALDLLDTDAVGRAIGDITAQHGPIDVLVNNGGSSICRPVRDYEDHDFHRLMQMHFFAHARLIRDVLPGMLGRRRGHVINIASISSKMGPWGHGGYAAAKCAIVSLTQTLAAEHPDSGVHFSYVHPGVIKTEFFDNPGYEQMAAQVRKHGIEPDMVARKVVRLLDRPRLELCVPRLYRILDWFKAIHPGWAHRIVARGSRPRR